MDSPEFELISKAKKGDETAFALLCEKYAPLLKKEAHTFCKKQYEQKYSQDDFEQEAHIAFYSALRTYQNDKKVTFGLYAKICIRNKLVSLLRTAKVKKSDKRQVEPERQTESGTGRRETIEKLEKTAEDVLSGYEIKVLRLYCEGRSYADIARLLDRNVKSVDNAIYRIKVKLRRNL